MANELLRETLLGHLGAGGPRTSGETDQLIMPHR